MKCTKAGFMGLSLIIMMTAAAPLVSAQAAHVQWDIISVNFGPPITFNPGGSASASAYDSSTITITGSGTFVAPASGGSSSAVTGGGTWKVVSKTLGTTSGTFVVTELVRWEESHPQMFVFVDNVGEANEAVGGLAVLRVAYSDGSQGVLTVSCNADPADNATFGPFAVFEGIIGSKGVIQYWNPPPFPSFFSLFHVN